MLAHQAAFHHLPRGLTVGNLNRLFHVDFCRTGQSSMRDKDRLSFFLLVSRARIELCPELRITLSALLHFALFLLASRTFLLLFLGELILLFSALEFFLPLPFPFARVLLPGVQVEDHLHTNLL